CEHRTAAVDGAVGDGAPTIVYTDGACIGNGSVGAKAGLGLFWSDGHPDNLSAPITGPPSSNRAECLAVIAALEKANVRNIHQLVFHTSMARWRKIKFEKVLGHSGDYGNEQADMLAKRGAEMYTGTTFIGFAENDRHFLEIFEWVY
uniref:ribonuclease H n=1 Tax=Globodera pallida TaxID=36090 RepID=A0A183CTY5_GLOPA